MGTRVLVALSLALATMAAGCTTSRSNDDSAGDFKGAQAQVASANANGLPAGSQGQTLQIQPNTGNSSTLQFVSPVTLNASTFN